ncbi:MAG: CPBP family intramembrane metalloprotease [Candidatus Helarchaeota archaeon]|nr:CPBP family intramembrane metalloprotease [Candidatus Helarchaeota archaeon]
MTEAELDTPWNWKSSALVFGLVIGASVSIFAIIQLGMLLLTGWQFDFYTGVLIAPGSIAGVWIGTVITELIILQITIIFAVYIFKGKMRHFNFKRPSKKHLLIAIGGAFAAYGLSILGGLLNYLITGDDPNQALYDALFQTSEVYQVIIWIILMMCVVAPCEEIFARGFVQKGLQNSCKLKKISVFIGIIIASLLFAVLHLDIYRIIPLFFVGIILGLVFYFTKDNSMASTITHGLYNSLGILLFFLFP